MVAPTVTLGTSDTYVFPETPASVLTEAAGEGELSPRALKPDTPKPTVDLWNSDREVTFGVFSKATICGARCTASGSEDFPACAVPDCTIGTHRAGREAGDTAKKPKKSDAVVMEMPGEGRFLAIFVPASSAATRPRIFSRLILPLDQLPRECQERERLDLLTGIQLIPRGLRLLIENYGGIEYMEGLAQAFSAGGQRADAELGRDRFPPPPLEVP